MTRQDDESGFTLAELVVVILLLSIVSIVLLGFLQNTTSVTARAEANVKAEVDAQFALRRISQNIRGANPLGASCGTGYANCLQFVVPRPGVNGSSTCSSAYRYELVSGRLLESRTDSNCGTGVASRTYAQQPVLDVTNASTAPVTPVFAYRDRFGRAISVSATCSADPAAPACPQQAKSVLVTLVVTFRPKVAPLVLTSTASLRNSR